MINRLQPPIGRAVEAPAVPSCETHRLSNDIPVYLLNRPGCGIATVQICTRIGAAFDGKSPGLCRFLAELMLRGAGDRNYVQFSDAIESSGSDINIDAERDFVSVSITARPDNVTEALSLAYDVICRPSFLQVEAKRVQQNLIAVAKQNLADPDWLADTTLRSKVFGDSPFAHPVDGWPATLNAIGVEDIDAAHRTMFSAGNLFVVVAGEIAEKETVGSLEEGLGHIGGDRPIELNTNGNLTGTYGTPHVVNREGSAHAVLRFGRRSMPRTHPSYPQFALLNTVLGNSFNSRINLRLREELGITYGAWTSLEGHRSTGLFSMGTSVHHSRLTSAIRAVRKILREVVDDLIPESELDVARNYMIGRQSMEVETVEELSSMIASLVLYDLPLDYFTRMVDQLRGTTPELIRRIAEEYLVPASMTIVVAGEDRIIQSELSSL